MKVGTAEIDFLANDLATKVIDKIDERTKKLQSTTRSATKESTKGFDSFTSSVKGLASTLGIATVAGSAAFAIKNFAVESAELAFRMEGLENAFNRLAGESAPMLLNRIEAASRGTVAEIDAVNAANRAMLLGIDPEALPQMMEIARASAQAMGTDVTSAFNDIATGIGRQSKLILDNLGIIIDVEAANQRYAESIGTTASELTDLERKQAFINEVMKVGKQNVDDMGGAINSQKEEVQALAAEWKNFKTDVGDEIITFLGRFALRLNLAKKAQERGVLGGYFSAFFADTESTKRYLADIEEREKALLDLQKTTDTTTVNNIQRIDESIRLASVTDDYKNALEDLQTQYESGSISASKLYVEQENLRTKYADDIDSINKIIALEKDRTTTLQSQTTAVRDLTSAQAELVKQFGGGAEFEKTKSEVTSGDVGATSTVKQLFGLENSGVSDLKETTRDVTDNILQTVIDKNKEIEDSIRDSKTATQLLNNKFLDSESILKRMNNELSNMISTLRRIDGARIMFNIDVEEPRGQLLDIG